MGLSANQIPLIEAIVSLAKQLETNLKGMGLTPNIDDYEYYSVEIEECVDTIQTITNIVLNKKAEPVRQTVRQVQQATEVRVHEPKAKPVTSKRPRHLWTDEEKREAMRMYAEGVDMDTIVKKFNSTPMSVQKIMQKNGIRRPWPTKGNPSQVAEAEPEPEAVPVPSTEEEPIIVIDRDVDAEARRLNEEREAEDRQRKADLKEYRKQHPKPYYLNR